MSTYVLMRILESAPHRYELGIRLLTLGRIEGAYDRLASRVERGQQVLDIGCGTGLSGEALRQAGFTTIDGTDFSEEMINAAATKDIYRALIRGDVNKPLPAGDDYVNFAAIGVFSPGHGMPDLIGTVIDRVPRGGCFGFSLNDHALQDPGYETAIRDLVEAGTVDLVFDEYGDHLTGLGSKSRVCVLKKL